MLPKLPPLDPAWYQNKAQGLVYTQSPTELTFRLYFPETVGTKNLELVRLVVDSAVAHCFVAEPFLALFEGETRSLYIDDKVLFASAAGFDREEATTMLPHEWIRQNVDAAESLLGKIDERRAFYRDQHLPDWDLKSGIIEKLVKSYKFHQREFASAELAAAEFCRRLQAKAEFQKLFHPEVSVVRFFGADPADPQRG